MAEQQTQPNGPAKPDTVGTAEESELDRLTSEFEATIGTDQNSPAANNYLLGLGKAIKPVVDYVTTEAQTKQVAEVEKDVKSAMDFMADGDDYKGISPRFVRGYLEDLAREDQSFKAAFMARRTNPDGWKGALAKAQAAFRSEVDTFRGTAVKDDVAAATASVRGTSTTGTKGPAFDPIKAEKMSDRDWETFRETLKVG